MVTYITIPDFKLYYRAIVVETAWFPPQKSHRNQWNRAENPGITSCNCSYLVLDKDAKIYCKEKIAYSTNSAGKPGTQHTEK